MHAALFSLHILYIIFSKYIFLCITIQLLHPTYSTPSFCLLLSSTLHPTYSSPSFCLLLSSTLHPTNLPAHLSAYCYPALFILPIFQSIFLLTVIQHSSSYQSSSPSFCLLLTSNLHSTYLPVHLSAYCYTALFILPILLTVSLRVHLLCTAI